MTRASAGLLIALLFVVIVFFPAPSVAATRPLAQILEEIETQGTKSSTIEELGRYVDEHWPKDSSDEALLKLARVYSETKDFGRAIDAYERFLDAFPASVSRLDALYEAASACFRYGNEDKALEYLAVLKSSANAPVLLKVKGNVLQREIESSLAHGRAVKPVTIGALLPLSGQYSQFGEAALKGVLLAAGIFPHSPETAKDGRGSSVEVIVRDTGAAQASAEGAVDELASIDTLFGAIGPLLSSNALEAVRHAQKKGLPVIALSQRPGLTDAGPLIFRLHSSVFDQTEALVAHAVAKGMKSFAVLYPKSAQGVEYAKRFSAEVAKRGAILRKEIGYEPGESDFSDEMRYIFGIMAKEKREGRKRVTEYSQTVHVDALFIPDTYETASVIAPYLDYFGISGTVLLGASGWNSTKLIALAGDDVEGAVFVDGFYAGSKRPGAQGFTGAFTAAYGYEPGLMEAQSHDATLLLIEASTKAQSRDKVDDELRAIKGIEGAEGRLFFGQGQEAQKQIFVLTVKDSRITEAE